MARKGDWDRLSEEKNAAKVVADEISNAHRRTIEDCIEEYLRSPSSDINKVFEEALLGSALHRVVNGTEGCSTTILEFIAANDVQWMLRCSMLGCRGKKGLRGRFNMHLNLNQWAKWESLGHGGIRTIYEILDQDLGAQMLTATLAVLDDETKPGGVYRPLLLKELDQVEGCHKVSEWGELVVR